MRCMSRESDRSSRDAARIRLTVVDRSCGEDSLGHVAGGPGPEGREGDLFVPAGRHQNHRNQRELAFDGRHQFQAVHLAA